MVSECVVKSRKPRIRQITNRIQIQAIKGRDMKTRKHEHQESFGVSVERLFMLLHTPSCIRKWWQAHRAIVISQTGGIWAAAWGDNEDSPDFISTATIRVFEPPRRLVLADYRQFAKTGPLPFQADFVTEFCVTPIDAGASLRIVQDGFPMTHDADEFFEACRIGWLNTFEGIRKYLDES